jgi:hypothetical protein
MRLEDRNLCVTGTELSCISELKDDGEAFLARYSDRTYVPRSRMRLGLIPIQLSTSSLPGDDGSAA